MKLDYNLIYKNDNIREWLEFEFRPKLGSEVFLKMNKQDSAEYPVDFYTCCNPLDDYIGNIVSLGLDNTCSVHGYIKGAMRLVNNVTVADPKILKVGQRVMVTEHLNISGQIDLLATTFKILESNVSYFNFGWSNTERSRFYRIDVHTGHHVEIKGPVILRKSRFTQDGSLISNK